MSSDAEGRLQRDIAAALATDLDAAFERLVNAYQHRVYGFVLNLIGDAHEAEELAQDAFVAAYRALRGYAAERRRSLSLRSWLFTIALNRVRNRARRAKPLSLDSGDALALVEARRSSPADDPEPVATRRERDTELRRAISTLPQRNRSAVVLRYVDGLEYDEISRTLERPQATIRSDVHRGLALLRKTYQERNDHVV